MSLGDRKVVLSVWGLKEGRSQTRNKQWVGTTLLLVVESHLWIIRHFGVKGQVFGGNAHICAATVGIAPGFCSAVAILKVAMWHAYSESS